MNVRSKFATALAASALMFTAACGNSSDSSSGGSAAGGSDSLAGKKVGFQFCAESNAWCAKYIDTIKERLGAEGIDVTVLTSNFDQVEDNQHIDQLIAQKPDVLMIGPADPNGAVPAILRAHQAGIKIVNVVSKQEPAAQSVIDVNVLAGYTEMGDNAASLLVEGLKKAGHDSGNIIAITGPATNGVVVDTLAAFKDTLAKNPEYQLVAVEDGSWDAAKTQTLTQQLLAQYASKGGIDGIYAQADYMAPGAIQAVKQAGLKLGVKDQGIIITSANCSPSGPVAIKADELYGTGTEGPVDEANAAADAVIKLLKGEDQEKVQYTKQYTVTADNIDEASRCEY
ncbi:sugar ABC transporter substrate-binding protein [Nocardioides sp.]|uniref:sugar ABC transporter substrate-binding protein n=1 Tax=Nocardioides sp. TaxID=35761 RepID=UPI0039E2AA91